MSFGLLASFFFVFSALLIWRFARALETGRLSVFAGGGLNITRSAQPVLYCMFMAAHAAMIAVGIYATFVTALSM